MNTLLHLPDFDCYKDVGRLSTADDIGVLRLGDAIFVVAIDGVDERPVTAERHGAAERPVTDGAPDGPAGREPQATRRDRWRLLSRRFGTRQEALDVLERTVRLLAESHLIRLHAGGGHLETPPAADEPEPVVAGVMADVTTPARFFRDGRSR